MKRLRKNVNAKVEPVVIKFSIPEVTVSYTSELNPLVDLSKKRCKKVVSVFKKRALKVQEIADFLLSLHLILEISINTLMRKLFLGKSNASNKDFMKMIENFDNINFLDKVIMFINNPVFKFYTIKRQEEAKEHEKIIGFIKNFNETRNRLIHGHSIIAGGSPNYSSRAYKKIKKTNMETQISLYRQIIQGLTFYLDCLEDLPDEEKQKYKEAYLDDSFLK